MRTRYSVLLLVSLLLTRPLHATTYYVDDDAPGDLFPHNRNVSDPNEDGTKEHPFDGIQEAIDTAVDGDTIVVKWGRYLSPDPWTYDEINFKGKNIRLVSLYPTSFDTANATVLCGVVIFQGDEDPNCLLQGFKIQNYGHGGILGNNTRATISHCIISGNGPCGATVVKDVHGLLKNCLIADNTTFYDCGVLPVVSGCWEIVNCTIANNLSAVGLSNFGLPAGKTVKIRNSIIYYNLDPQFTYQWGNSAETKGEIEYCLIESPANTMFPRATNIKLKNVQDADPCFVQLGSWQDTPTGRAIRRSVSAASVAKVLVEGDYHLKSEGWRWVSDVMHWSHWYYDPVTSPGVDAGDPMDSLGEEPERAWQDPEGRDGFNHAIDMGAYGGTLQASMSPTRCSPDNPPGVGAVDLRDYWPLVGTRNEWHVHNPQGTARRIDVTNRLTGAWGEVYYLRTTLAPDWVTMVYSYYAGRTLYMTKDAPVLNPSQPLQPPAHAQAQYPQYLIAGSTMEAPYDPFVNGGAEYRSVLVLRGALAEVLADTSVDPNQLLAGSWPDVIALREIGADGTAGDPTTIFARGFGPLVLAGQPIEGAVVNSKTFGTGTGGTGTRATR